MGQRNLSGETWKGKKNSKSDRCKSNQADWLVMIEGVVQKDWKKIKGTLAAKSPRLGQLALITLGIQRKEEGRGSLVIPADGPLRKKGLSPSVLKTTRRRYPDPGGEQYLKQPKKNGGVIGKKKKKKKGG